MVITRCTEFRIRTINSKTSKSERRQILTRKQGFIKSIWLIGLVLIFSTHVTAETKADYESNGSVGFYGKYVFPDKEKPEVPDPGVTPPPVVKPAPKPSVTLPQTGEKGTELVAVTGMVTLLSIYLIVTKRKEVGE